MAPLIGTELLANREIDLDFVERLLATLAHAGLSGARLVAGYNAVIAALVGFTTQEFAPSLPSTRRTGRTGSATAWRACGTSATRLLAGNMSCSRIVRSSFAGRTAPRHPRRGWRGNIQALESRSLQRAVSVASDTRWSHVRHGAHGHDACVVSSLLNFRTGVGPVCLIDQ